MVKITSASALLGVVGTMAVLVLVYYMTISSEWTDVLPVNI